MYLLLAGLVAVGFVAYLLLNNRNMKTYRHFMKRMKKLDKSIDFFNATQKFSNQNMAIAINEEEKKLCVSTMKNGNPVSLVHTFNDIISCEIIENEVDETTASIREKRVANVLADTVGKVTGEKEEEGKINRIDLKISFKDPQNPFVLANFLYWEVSKHSDEYKTASKSANCWYGIINESIKKERVMN